MRFSNDFSIYTGPDPEMLLPGGGGALKAEVLNRAAKARGGRV